MQMKKMLAALTAAALIGSNSMLSHPTITAPAHIFALAEDEQEEVTVGDLIFLKYEDHAEVVYCADDAAEVVIPAEADGLPVTRIGDFAFQSASVTSVTIPDSITSIGDGAFCACFSLTDIVIPDSVTSIGSYLFTDCTALTSVTLPNGVTSIGDQAFRGCTALTAVTIPDGVTSIGEYAFADCTSLTDVTIPDSVTSIGAAAFGKSIIGETPWLAAQREKDPLVIINGILIDGTDCKDTMVVIPDGVTSIGENAFYLCYSLTAVVIPDRVTSIGEGAFSGFSEQAEIWGKPGSAAESFALSNHKSFHSIDDPEIYSGMIFRHRAQQEIIDYMKQHPVALENVSYATEPDLNAPYAPGKLDSATEQSALNMLNTFRFIAGLDEAALSEEYSREAQGASLLCAVSSKCSHTLGQPSDMSDELYEVCSRGSHRSNLGEGNSSPAASVLGYMEDTSPLENIQSVGHRRWCLNPQMEKTGFGYVENMTAMYALDRTHPLDTFGVCWPAENTPVELAPSVWSFTAGVEIDENADVQVTLTRENDGKQWHFSKTGSDGDFYIDNQSTGQPGCIIFRPDDVGGYRAGDVFTVSITGTKQSPSYTVHFFKTGFPEMAFAAEGQLGDVNGDGAINASDAAVILIAAAKLGAADESGLTAAQEAAADVNGDKLINASDAAIILQYAATVGAGSTDTLAEYLSKHK